MTTICVEGVPAKFTIHKLIKKISWTIKGNFEALCFRVVDNKKTCFIQLSPTLNAKDICNRINKTQYGNYMYHAYIPQYLPEGIRRSKKSRVLPEKLRRMMGVRLDYTKDQALLYGFDEILKEMVFKYTGLLKLSQNTKHELMENICVKIVDRIKLVANKSGNVNSPFQLTDLYRKAYPHFGDFQLILSTLHMIEDSAALPRTQINEKELTVLSMHPLAKGDLPSSEATKTYKVYTNRIIKKVTAHINNLNTDPAEMESEEDNAKVKVRQALKKINPFMQNIVNEVISKYFVQKNPLFYYISVYGEPYLPRRDKLDCIFKAVKTKSTQRSERMYNLVNFKIRPSDLSRLLAMDGLVVDDGCKLVVRPKNMPMYKFSDSVKNQLLSDSSAQEKQQLVDVEMSEEKWESW